MGIPDGFLDETTWRTLLLIGSLILATSIRKTLKELDDKSTIKFAVIGGCILLTRSLNLPVPGGYAALIGAALPSLIFGAWPASLLMGLVLIVECVAFTDIGITNLGLLYLAVGFAAPHAAAFSAPHISKYLGNLRWLAPLIAAWLSVVSAALVNTIVVTLTVRLDISEGLSLLYPYLSIGLIEGVLTALGIRLLSKR